MESERLIDFDGNLDNQDLDTKSRHSDQDLL